MNNLTGNPIVSRWLTALTLLALAYSIQVYPFYHLHHFHQDGSLEFQVSSHPIGVDISHSSDHHHDHDGDRSHGGDHQNHYEQHIDWPIIRVQTPRIPTLIGQYLSSSTIGVLTDDNRVTYSENDGPPYINRFHVSYLMFRGPPSLG